VKWLIAVTGWHASDDYAEASAEHDHEDEGQEAVTSKHVVVVGNPVATKTGDAASVEVGSLLMLPLSACVRVRRLYCIPRAL
jgi:hypothetical protein